MSAPAAPMVSCAGCEAPTDQLDLFPGGVCLDCHRVAVASVPPPPLNELVAAFSTLAAFGP